MDEKAFAAQFGAYLRQLRHERGLTLQDIATAVGVTTSAVGHWENGRRLPKLHEIHPLADAIGVTVERLAKGLRYS